MLALRQDAVFIIIMEHEERQRYTINIKWYGFRFSLVQRKSTAVFMLQLETAEAA